MNPLVLLFFPLAAVFSFYIPGYLLLGFAKKTYTKEETFSLSWFLGVAVFLLLSYAFAWLQIPRIIPGLLVICFLYAVIKKREVFRSLLYLFSFDRISLFFIILGSLLFCSLTFFSGFLTSNGYTLYDVNQIDGLVHLALIKTMVNTFPPQNPSLAGEALRGYHYFYNFLLSRFALFYQFLPRDLEFRLFPIFISLCYGFAFSFFASLFTKNMITKRLILFFAYFGEPAGFIYTLFTSRLLSDDIGFPFSPQLILDPSVVISIALLLGGLFFIFDKRKNIFTAVFAGLFLGILSEVKVYAGLIGIGVLLITSFYEIARDKKVWAWFVQVIFFAGVLTIATFFPNNFGAGSLLFAPFLSYEHFISQPMFDELKWSLTVQTYLAHGNYLHTIEKYFEAFGIFWLLILGIRSVVILFIGKFFKKTFWANEKNVVLLIIFVVPFIFGSFFIQTVSVFDIMQFFWIGVALFSIPVGIVYAIIFEKFSLPFRIGLLTVILAFSVIPICLLLYNTFFVSSSQSFTVAQIDLLRYAGRQVPVDSFLIVIPPYNSKHLLSVDDLDWYREPLVAALTARNTYYEPAIAYYHMYSSLYDDRKKDVFDLTKALESCNVGRTQRILQRIGTSFIISFAQYPCIGSTPFTIQKKSTGGIYFYAFQ